MGSVSLINGHIDETEMTPQKASEVLEMFLHKQCDLKRTEFAYNANEVWEAVKKSSEALEKQIPKKPTPHIVNVEKIKIGNANWCKGTTVYKCPCCNNFISRLYDYCYKCGQAIDWSKNNGDI